MKTGIHPTYYPDAQVICACGNTWTTGSTQKVIHTDVCSKCHPFFTGEQRIVDSAGQVDRFMKRLSQYDAHQQAEMERQAKLRKKREQRFLKQQLLALELPEEIHQVFHEANIITVGDLAAKLEKDRDSLLALEGIDEQVLADTETRLATARELFFAEGK
ncbi:MAG: 50S ribosomal protein L31 [Chloroflexi bacterium]|nr:MAG: 50S ribosomal protein L31 [Chloroflexota bacterium]